MHNSFGILTTAWGKPRYLEMAKGLGRSLLVHQPDIPRAIITDSDDPELLALFNRRIQHRPQYGPNFAQKLHLDHYTPFEGTLYLDSDCLVVRPIAPLLDLFDGLPFTIPTRSRLTADDGDWDMDNARVLAHFNLSSIPKFNGGLMYFTRSATANAIFTTAREIYAKYEDIGFWMLPTGSPNDEPMYAVAMELHGISGVDDGNRTMLTPFGMRGSMQVNVLRGICSFNKGGQIVSPSIIHFPAGWQHDYRYRRERKRLELHMDPTLCSRLCESWLPAVASLAPAFRYRVGRLLRYFRLHASLQTHH